MKAYGKKVWLIPDTFLSSVSGEGEQISHEAICVTNTGGRDAHISLTLLYEDKPEIGGFHAECGVRRTHHIRLDRIRSDSGEPIQRDVQPTRYIKHEYGADDNDSLRRRVIPTAAT